MCYRTVYLFGCRHPSSATMWHDCHMYGKHHKETERIKLVPLCPSCERRQESLYLSQISHQAQYGDDDSTFTGHTGYTSDSGLSGQSHYTHGHTYDEVSVNVRHRSQHRGGSSVRIQMRR